MFMTDYNEVNLIKIKVSHKLDLGDLENMLYLPPHPFQDTGVMCDAAVWRHQSIPDLWSDLDHHADRQGKTL